MRYVLALLLTSTLIACSESSLPTATGAEAGGGPKVDSTPRVNLVFDDSVDIASPGGLPDWRIAGVRGDGRLRNGTIATESPSNEYQGSFCGVHGVLDSTGSMDFDADTYYASSMAAACGAKRYLRFFLNGAESDPLQYAPHTVANNIAQVVVGESRTFVYGFGIQQPNCQRLRYDDTYAGSSNALVTRLPDVNGARQWRIESRGTHHAMCVLLDKRGNLIPTGVTYFLPFAMTVTEVKYPFPTYP
jgi:hypothetical protein